MAVHTLPDITVGAAQRISATTLPCTWFMVQAVTGNGAVMRVGDSGVGTAEGAIVSTTGTVQFPPCGNANTYNLYDTWIFGTASDKAAVTYGTS